MTKVKRQYIRHPSDTPIEYYITDRPPICSLDYMNNVSIGGLSFHCDEHIEPLQWIHLYIPIDQNHFETDAQVRWCQLDKNNMGYDIGVRFSDKSEAFSTRMIEQICYIEQYRKTVSRNEGRTLSSDEAATEWIARFADTFPSTDNNHH